MTLRGAVRLSVIYVVVTAMVSGLALFYQLAQAESRGDLTYPRVSELCGDVNQDGWVDLADLIYLWIYIFGGGAAPPNLGDVDVDGCGCINAADLVYLSVYLFEMGPAPCDGACAISHGINKVSLQCDVVFPLTSVDSVGVEVFIQNESPLAAMSLGFSYVANEIYDVTNVTRAASFTGGFFRVRFLPAVNQFLIGWMDETSSNPFPVHSPAPIHAFTVWVKRSAGLEDGCVDISRAFVAPAGPFIFSSENGDVILPQFIDCVGEPEVSAGDGCNSSYPQFDAHQHWSFGNSENLMWPDTMWSQFDYCSEGTPCKRCCILCESEDYPSWELFVDAIGGQQAYFDPPPGNTSFRPSALAEWSAIKQPWSGSCFGFALTEALYIDSLLPLLADFSGCTELGSVSASNNSRDIINRFNLYQFGLRNQQRMVERLRTVRFDQALIDIQAMLNRVTGIDQVLMMFNSDGIGAHAVYPYYCQTIDGSNWHVYVHDSNFPNDLTKYVTIHLEGWEYSGLPGWGGEYGLFLLDSLASCLEPLVLMDTTEANQQIHFYFGEAQSAYFSSSQGELGFNDDYIYSTVEGGYPILPIDSRTSLPTGYMLPTDEWYFDAVGVVDGVFTIIDGERRVFRIGGAKSGIISAPAADQSAVTIFGSSVKLGGKGICDTAFIEVISVSSDSEIVVTISDVIPVDGDTISVTLTDTATVQIDNYGAPINYDLQIQIVSVTTDTSFYHANVTLDQNCAHLILPDWRSTHDSVIIRCDEGIDGSFDSTFAVSNSVAPQYKCGDADGNSIVTISDAVYLINYVFAGGPAPYPLSAGDADCNGIITVSDVVYLINYIFAGGAVPCAPCP